MNSAFEAFIDRGSTAAERSDWVRRFSLRTPHRRLPQELATSDQWLSTGIAEIFRTALDREPDSAG